MNLESIHELKMLTLRLQNKSHWINSKAAKCGLKTLVLILEGRKEERKKGGWKKTEQHLGNEGNIESFEQSTSQS